MKLDNNYWKTLMFLCVTAVTVLVFTLGYYYIEVIIDTTLSTQKQ